MKKYELINYRVMFSSIVPEDDFWDIDWEANENIPDCALGLNYPKPENLIFEQINPDYFKIVEIDIKKVLDDFPSNEGYHLKPYKWYRVRNSFVNCIGDNGAPIEYPEVLQLDDGSYQLSDGRHRLNALMKIYGLTTTKAKVWIDQKW